MAKKKKSTIVEYSKLDEIDITKLLRERFRAPEYAFLTQVRNATGYRRTERYADGIAMSLWPSRGLEITGFEIKRSRRDLLTELRKPDKSAPIQQFCDRWYLVLGDERLIQPGELPPTWGLMIVRGKSQLRIKVEAPKLDSKPLTREFTASVMRNFEQTFISRIEHQATIEEYEKSINEKVEESIKDELEFRTRDIQRKLEYAERDRDNLKELHKQFRDRAGVDLTNWNLGNIADAVQVVKDCGTDRLRAHLERTKRAAEAAVKMCDDGLAAIVENDPLAKGLLRSAG